MKLNNSDILLIRSLASYVLSFEEDIQSCKFHIESDDYLEWTLEKIEKWKEFLYVLKELPITKHENKYFKKCDKGLMEAFEKVENGDPDTSMLGLDFFTIYKQNPQLIQFIVLMFVKDLAFFCKKIGAPSDSLCNLINEIYEIKENKE